MQVLNNDTINQLYESITATANAFHSSKPNVMEPDDIYAAYQEYKTVWEVEPVLRWEEWFGTSQSNSQRYHKSIDTYRYIDRVVGSSSTSTSSSTAREVCDKLTRCAEMLKVSVRDFVKNCMYHYYHPCRKSDVKRPPKCTRTQLEQVIANAELPPLK